MGQGCVETNLKAGTKRKPVVVKIQLILNENCSFFHQLSQKMTTDCPLILHIENMLTIHIFKKDCSGSRFLLQTLLTYSICSQII